MEKITIPLTGQIEGTRFVPDDGRPAFGVGDILCLRRLTRNGGFPTLGWRWEVTASPYENTCPLAGWLGNPFVEPGEVYEVPMGGYRVRSICMTEGGFTHVVVTQIPRA